MAMRSSCQTWALIPDARGQGSRQIGHPCPVAGGKRPVSRPASRKRIKAEFDYDDRKGVGACDRVPSGLGKDDEIPYPTDKTVHMKCAVSPISKAGLIAPPFHVPSPGRSVTRARRLYVSRIANSVKATPNTGQSTRMCTAATAPRMAHLAGTPLPL